MSKFDYLRSLVAELEDVLSRSKLSDDKRRPAERRLKDAKEFLKRIDLLGVDYKPTEFELEEVEMNEERVDQSLTHARNAMDYSGD